MPNVNTNWDAEDDDDEDSGQSQNDPKSLRAYAKKTAKENEALKAKIAAIETAARKSLVTQTIKDKGMNPKIAAFIPESIGADSDAIDKWLEEYKDVFSFAEKRGKSASTADDDTDDDEDFDISTDLDEADFDRAAQERMSRASASSLPATKRADLSAKLNDPNLTREQLDKVLAALGNQKVMPFK